MKFMFFFYPALAATWEERRRMRPIARHTEPWQKMFSEVAALSRMAEDLGFDARNRAAFNPEWFIWQSDQGYLPLEQVKQMLHRFGKEILPHYL